MDDPEEERKRMREAAMKVIGQKYNNSDSGRMATLSPRWQTLIDDDIVEAYRASFRRTRRFQRQKTSLDTDSIIIPSQRPYSMSDLTLDTRPNLRDTDDNCGSDNLEQKSYVGNYGRLWKEMDRSGKPQYLDSATGGEIDESTTVESSKYQTTSYPDKDKTEKDLPPDTFEMIPYPDYPDEDQDQEAETSLNNQATLPLRRRSYDWKDDDAGVLPREPPPEYKDVVVDPSAIELMTVENGTVDTTQDTEGYECTNLGPLNSLRNKSTPSILSKKNKNKNIVSCNLCNRYSGIIGFC
ncbi:hypothetical protein KUTeg_002081 [Tegillarca granosa]|uniref:Uncharacterized protein n=1 Tax=Tegillarca granosa TaxID=220873 RepID=A0ABQ9FTA5_TEGGR|nr:hypothetical protein KUTeg_002081 [Tegillarca granosa]